MSILIPILIAVALFFSIVIWGTRGHRAIGRGLRTISALDEVTASYREGDYETALQQSERLRTRFAKTAAYCFFRGSMLFHLGRLEEAEASLREGLPMEENPAQRALVCNTLGAVLMEQRRFAEAIESYENAGRAWPERGSNHRGIAEVWLRMGCELPKALQQARLAVEIDRKATGMKQEALDSRIGEDLALLAWAVAANAGEAREVECLLGEAFPLCGSKTKPVLAELHYHAGQAYAALNMLEKSQEHLRKASEADPHGIFGKRARTTSG